MNSEIWHSTTIIGVRRNGKVAMASDGQVTMGETIIKQTAKKIRKLHHDKVLVGFAGATGDAFTLFERFEQKLDEHSGNLPRAVVELAKDWRTDRLLRRLESLLAVVDSETALIISGDGNVIEPTDGVIGIGSGGMYAVAAARALLKHSSLSAEQVVRESLLIAAGICVFTNDQITVETL